MPGRCPFLEYCCHFGADAKNNERVAEAFGHFLNANLTEICIKSEQNCKTVTLERTKLLIK